MGASAHVFGRLLFLCLAALALGFAVPVAGVPSAAARQSQTQLQRTLRGRFLHITDFHPDELYKIHSSSAQGKACHRGHGTAGVYGAEKTDCDSPFALADQSLNWIAENLKHDTDFVVWTGDSARHDSDDKHPRSELGILDSNRDMVDKFIHTFSDSDGKLSVPIIPTFGNNDFLPHNIMNAGPNRWFRAYSDIWRRFIPEAQRPSFLHGGWFYIEVIPDKLAVLSLNTMFFFERNTAVDGCADPSEPGYEHMEWLRIQLQSMRDRGMKALLMGHVPPARTDNKQLWDETCWQKYTLWLHQYRDVVTGSLYGHMNIDHFMLQDTQQLDLGQESDGLHIRELDFASEDEGDDDDDGMYDDGNGDDKKLHTQSKGDYLLDLREEWSDLPDSIMETLQDRDSVYEQAARVERLQKPLMRQEKTKKRKGKKDKNDEDIGGEHAERYHVSLVSPSVVPNYFPTLRVFDYNISGLEEVPVWEDGFDELKSLSWDLTQARKNDEDRHFELRRDAVIAMAVKEQKKQEGAQQAGQGKLLVPELPAKELLPGPAHYPQPLTLTGYVQYYANLTYINEVSASKRRGGRSDETPRHSPPQPRKFKYEVEYSTFDDELYRLRDLTVKRFVHLAYRMGHKRQNEARAGAAESEDGSRDGKERGEDREAVMKKRRKGKKSQRKRKKRKGESNKTWLHFLNHAFVKTVPAEELEKL